MPLASFLRSLFEDGRVRVPSLEPLADSGLTAADQELSNFEALYRLELPSEPPALDLVAGRWAAICFYRACQFTVHRDLPAELIQSEPGRSCPARHSPRVDYSVDLVFRFLPDLLNFARSASENDPLVVSLREWARQWPLSSVGVPDLGPLDCSSFLEHPALLTLYVGRILARGDATRLREERVRQAVETAVGMHRQLAGKLPLEKETPA
jgi:hypothetical protein